MKRNITLMSMLLLLWVLSPPLRLSSSTLLETSCRYRCRCGAHINHRHLRFNSAYQTIMIVTVFTVHGQSVDNVYVGICGVRTGRWCPRLRQSVDVVLLRRRRRRRHGSAKCEVQAYKRWNLNLNLPQRSQSSTWAPRTTHHQDITITMDRLTSGGQTYVLDRLRQWMESRHHSNAIAIQHHITFVTLSSHQLQCYWKLLIMNIMNNKWTLTSGFYFCKRLVHSMVHDFYSGRQSTSMWSEAVFLLWCS